MPYTTSDGRTYHYCTLCMTKDFDLFYLCPNCNQRQRKKPRSGHREKEYKRI